MSITKDGKTYRTYQEQVDYLTRKKNEILEELANFEQRLEEFIKNPMISSGDLIIGGEGGTPTRLAKGNNNKVLKIKNGSPSWEDDAGGMENPMTSAGDLIVGGENGNPTRLAKGSNNKVLKIKNNNISWEDDAGGMENPMTSAGDLIVGGEDGVPIKLAKGNDNEVLKIKDGNLSWADGNMYIYIVTFEAGNLFYYFKFISSLRTGKNNIFSFNNRYLISGYRETYVFHQTRETFSEVYIDNSEELRYVQIIFDNGTDISLTPEDISNQQVYRYAIL